MIEGGGGGSCREGALGLTMLRVVALAAAAAAAPPVPIDFSAVGPTFDGVGALSGGGGTSRLWAVPAPHHTSAAAGAAGPEAA